ncbi:hypothetical protein ACYSNR_13720 [Enterococcus sp. LJL128]|uniref:hypothetical protein n=1 Tax=Enterococcus sp. LJL51 TaxID=3416656 RepID=UPI003CF901F8
MFKNTSKLIYRGVEEKTSKTGNPYKIARFADPVSYQILEFFCDDSFVATVKVEDPCTVELKCEKRGYNMSFTCLSAMSA